MKRIFALILALLLLPALALSALAADVPEPSADFYVYDGAGTLSQSTKDLILNASGPLEKYCDGAQIVVVTIDYLPSGYDSEQYANLLFNSWGIGSSSANNGMLLLHVVKEDRGWLAVGAGISSQVSTDSINSLMDSYFWPYSDAGEYDKAVATLFPHLVDIFAALYNTSALYGGTGSTQGGDYYEDSYYDPYYDDGPSLGTVIAFILIILLLVLSFAGSLGRRRYYGRAYYPSFFFCGGQIVIRDKAFLAVEEPFFIILAINFQQITDFQQVQLREYLFGEEFLSFSGCRGGCYFFGGIVSLFSRGRRSVEIEGAGESNCTGDDKNIEKWSFHVQYEFDSL